MRNRAIATIGFVGAGMLAGPAPVAGNPGGVGPERVPQGGISKETAPKTGPMGGVSVEASVEDAAMAAKLRYVRQHMRNNTSFRFLTLDPEAGAQIVVTSGNLEIPSPLVILTENGSDPAAYIGRRGEKSMAVIPAADAEVTEFIGHTAIPVDDPLEFLAPHTLRNTADSRMPGFRAETGAIFAQMP